MLHILHFKIGDKKMKRKIIGICVMALLIGTVVSVVNSVSACTGFTASDGENVLVGNNFDLHDFNMYMHFFPAEEDKFGRLIFDIWWPSEDNPDYILPKQGMNDQGLFFDLYLTPTLYPINSSDKPIFNNNDPDYYDSSYWAYCLAKCSTVSEVLEIFDQYNLEVMYFFQAFFVDKYGDSVIIEGDDIIYREGDFQVITNFYHSHPELGGIGGYPCWRYNTAVSMLENMTELSVDYFTSICNVTHVDDHSVFSPIYDLKQGKIWIYYFHNYDRVLEFDLNEEIEKGESRTYLGSLFEPEGNQPPNKPSAPTGNESGVQGEDIKFNCRKTSDPDGDRTSYLFDWGDGTDSGWLPLYYTAFSVNAYHNWTEKGDYEVKVKAKDIYGRESEWSDPLSITMPKNKSINPVLFRLLEDYPNLYHIFRQMFGL